MSPSDVTVPLGSITTWLSGGTPDRDNSAYWNGSIPWISAATLKTTRIHDSVQRLTEAGLRSGSWLAPQGATLVLVRGMALHREIRAGMAARPVSFNQDVKALIPRRGLVPEFLPYALHACSQQIRELVSSAGSGTGVLDTGLLKRLPIWLPEIDEQRSIVGVLADAESSIDMLTQLVAKKQAIKQGMMQELLTCKARLPGFAERWSTTTLGSFGTLLKGRGVTRDDVRPAGVPCIRYGELYTAFNDYTTGVRSFVGPEIATTALPLRSGDLLFAGSGETRDEIGKCVAYLGKTPAVAGGDIVVLRGSSELFNPIYLALLANAPNVVDQKSRAGQGDAVVHISSRALAAIEVRVPQRPEQDAIAKVLTTTESEIAALRARLGKAKAVKVGMMQELLTGRTRLPIAGNAE